MTRPKTYTARYELRLTPAEKIAWNAKAAAIGMDLSEYIRRCVERRTLTTALPEVNRTTALELGRIGVNLNQQIRAMNTAIASGQYIPNVSGALSVVEEVYQAVKKLQSELLGTDDRQNS
jgi:antitoxin component of RelBE/YafQ-DinJ toxin-antitoxin module